MDCCHVLIVGVLGKESGLFLEILCVVSTYNAGMYVVSAKEIAIEVNATLPKHSVPVRPQPPLSQIHLLLPATASPQMLRRDKASDPIE